MGPSAVHAPPAHGRQTAPFYIHGRRYTAILDPRKDPPMWVQDERGRRFESPAQRKWKPWKLQVGDVDGDGRPDLLLGIIKSTHQLHFPHTTLFVYTFDGKQIRRKWMGSTMGRPLLDFTLAKADSKGWQPLFTLERTLQGRVDLSRYQWHVFGFQRNSHQQEWSRASHLHSVHGMISLIADGHHVRIDPSTWK